MSKLFLPNSSQFLSDLASFFSYIHSHPYHYFSYFIFFSPFLFKLIYFLSPLFITTTLLLLAFLTKNQESHVGFLISTYKNIIENLKSKGSNEIEQEFPHLEVHEVFNVFFETCMHGVIEEIPVEAEETIVHAIESTVVEQYSRDSGNSNINLDEKLYGNAFEPIVKANACKEKYNLDEDAYFHKEDQKVDEEKEELSSSKESEAIGIIISQVLNKEGIDSDKKLPKVVDQDFRIPGTYFDCDDNFVAYEPNLVKEKSMRLEAILSFGDEDIYQEVGETNVVLGPKEMRNTLACKFLEERHSMHATMSEGMDMLWDTHEFESVNVEKENANKLKTVESSTDFYEDFDEEFDEDDFGVQVCCLQPFKVSAGRMNLGMRGPSLRKISKAFKGIRWLHRMSRHGKKVHTST